MSNQLAILQLRGTPLSIAIVQAYEWVSDESVVERVYDKLQDAINGPLENYVSIVQGDCNAGVGTDLAED